MDKFSEVCELLKELDSAVLAFSGGYDSSYLAEACVRSLDRPYAIFVDMPIVSRRQRFEAERIANDIGIPLKIIEIGWGDLTDVLGNDLERCYFCKKTVYSAVKELGKELGMDLCLCGDNYDDILKYRPGRRAASELGVLSPLETLRITRSNVLDHVNSKNWSKNMIKDTCLATRIPTGTVLTKTSLNYIEDWESLIRDVTGVGQVRFRYFGDDALIQTSPEETAQLRNNMPELNRIALKKGLSLRFDPEGYKEF